jgi:formylglycine-generating enzyme required for sulfatase activity
MSERTTSAPERAVGEMVWVPGGRFTMGSGHHYPEEAPAHEVVVDGFWIDRHPVTNAQFATFVEATGHITVAEQAPDATDYPGADPALLVPASAVFTPPPHPVPLTDAYRWWSSISGAGWRHPRGPDSDLAGVADHPVVHVAWPDVLTYAAWAGKEIPTEAEWEFAARGGREAAEYAWGDELTPDGAHLANVWQGDFPVENRCEDGYRWTSPVGAFPANGYGLLDMIGNVWEWAADWWAEHRRLAPATPNCCGPGKVRHNPTGGRQDLSVDPDLPLAARTTRKVIKGGSYLCAPNYCRRYRPAARLPQAVDTATCHLGFRCVVRAT